VHSPYDEQYNDTAWWDEQYDEQYDDTAWWDEQYDEPDAVGWAGETTDEGGSSEEPPSSLAYI
jgi:hypothetical protein